MLLKLDSYDSPDAQALLRVGAERLERVRRTRRELMTGAVAAGAFLLTATLIAVLASWQRTLSPVDAGLVLGVWVALERVKFPVADGWTYPTMVVFVPALFVLPTPIVPLLAMIAIVLRAAPQLARRRVAPAMLASFVADAWFTIGPVLVIVLGGAQRFSWSHWPVYAAAVLAEVVIDATVSTARVWIGEGVNPRIELSLLSWIYIVDIALAPLGLMIAAGAVHHPALVLVALSPMVMLIAFARERQQRLDQTLALSTAYRGTALLLGDVVEADDHYTGLHSRDVVDLSLAVADALGLDATRRRNIEFAALLHDIGKLRVPKEIINKSGDLDAEEWAVLRRHTIEGETMLRQVGGILSQIGRYVRSSHERYDGLGYPDGLAGEQIPIESRIVSACDAFSAMTTDRAYRPALSVHDAIDELDRCAGSHFDADVVRALEALARTRIAPRDRYALSAA